MHTIVLNTAGLSLNLDLGLPLLYPLLKEGRLLLVSAGPDETLPRFLARALEETRTYLRRQGDPKWQMVLIFDLAAPRHKESEPVLYRCLTTSLSQVNRDLDDAIPPNQSDCLARRIVILFDTLKRDPGTLEPVDPDFQTIWQYDAQGYLDGGGTLSQCLLTPDDIKKLDDMWSSDRLEAVLKEGDVREDESLDGLVYLYPDKGCEIERSLKEIDSAIESIINEKSIQKNSQNALIPDERYHFTDEKNFSKIVKGLQQQTSHCRNRIGNLTSFKPGCAVKLLLRDTFSLHAEEFQPYAFIRFRAASTAPSPGAEPHFLIRLVKLVLYLCEQSEFVYTIGAAWDESRLVKDKFWYIDARKDTDEGAIEATFHFDQGEIKEVLEKYYNRLMDLDYRLGMMSDQVAEAEIILIEDNCSLNTDKTKKEIDSPGTKSKTGAVKDREPYEAWKGFRNFVQHQLDDHAEELANKFMEHRREIAKRKLHYSKEKAVDLKFLLSRLKDKLGSIKSGLDGMYYQRPSHDWQKLTKNISDMMLDIQKTGASPIRAWATGIFCFLIMAVPWIVSLKPRKELVEYATPDVMAIVGASVLAVFTVHMIIKRLRRRSIRKLMADAESIRESAVSAMEAIHEENLEYLKSICQLGISARNVRRTETRLAEAYLNQAQIHYHQALVTKHKQFAEHLAELFELSIKKDWNHPDDDELSHFEQPKKPAHEELHYAPLVAIENIRYEIQQVKQQGHVDKFKSKYIFGLRSIKFQRDSAYWRQNNDD